MNRNKHKILVLSDLKENAKDTIQYAISVARETNSALELLCIKKPNEIITTENPLAAMRTLSSEFLKTEQKAKHLIRSITKDDFFPVKSTIEFGNVKNEIENYIKRKNPNFIILGKKQKKLFSLQGDNLSDFILKKYDKKAFIVNKDALDEFFNMLNRNNIKRQTA